MFKQAEQVVQIVLKRLSSESRIHTSWFSSVLGADTATSNFSHYFVCSQVESNSNLVRTIIIFGIWSPNKFARPEWLNPLKHNIEK